MISPEAFQQLPTPSSKLVHKWASIHLRIQRITLGSALGECICDKTNSGIGLHVQSETFYYYSSDIFLLFILNYIHIREIKKKIDKQIKIHCYEVFRLYLKLSCLNYIF